jgi:hypothetical protein
LSTNSEEFKLSNQDRLEVFKPRANTSPDQAVPNSTFGDIKKMDSNSPQFQPSYKPIIHQMNQ